MDLPQNFEVQTRAARAGLFYFQRSHRRGNLYNSSWRACAVYHFTLPGFYPVVPLPVLASKGLKVDHRVIFLSREGNVARPKKKKVQDYNKFWLVVKEREVPYRKHLSEDAARAEAKRLVDAGECNGRPFFVCEVLAAEMGAEGTTNG